MLTVVARDQRWPDVVAGIAARFSKFAFVLFCYITNDWSLGEQWNLFPSNLNVFLDFVLGNNESIKCLPYCKTLTSVQQHCPRGRSFYEPHQVPHPVPHQTLGWREALWELNSALSKNTTQSPLPALKPRPLNLESSALTITPVYLYWL